MIVSYICAHGRALIVSWRPHEIGYALIARSPYVDQTWIVPGTWRELEEAE